VGTPSISRDAADQMLAGLGAAHDRVAAAMFALDSQPALGYLRGSTLTGTTASRWQTLRPELDVLWAHFTLLGVVVEQARAIRGARRPGDAEWGELSAMLQESTIGLDAAGLPADGSGNPAVTWIKVWDLAQQLEQRCAAVAAQLSEVDAAWSAVAGRLGPIAEAVDKATALAAELGAASTVEPLRATLANLQSTAIEDPLAAAPGGRVGGRVDDGLRELSARVDTTRQRLAELKSLRDGYQQRVAGLRGLADDVIAAERELAEVYARVTEKILDPGLAALPSFGAGLRTTADQLERLGVSGEWATLADTMAATEKSAREARERVSYLRQVATGLLDRREELRGRLDAYRAKAASKGVVEHPELTNRYDEAHRVMFTAPCDLRAGTRAVLAYQQTLSALLEE
jgi:hypothetical protein